MVKAAILANTGIDFNARWLVPLELSEASAAARVGELRGAGPALDGNKCGGRKRRRLTARME